MIAWLCGMLGAKHEPTAGAAARDQRHAFELRTADALIDKQQQRIRQLQREYEAKARLRQRLEGC